MIKTLPPLLASYNGKAYCKDIDKNKSETNALFLLPVSGPALKKNVSGIL